MMDYPEPVIPQALYYEPMPYPVTVFLILCAFLFVAMATYEIVSMSFGIVRALRHNHGHSNRRQATGDNTEEPTC